MAYTVELKAGASREYLKLSGSIQSRVKEAIDSLAENPRPPGFKALKGEKGVFRIRVGDYRIVYEIQAGILVVLVIRIAHRREVYR